MFPTKSLPERWRRVAVWTLVAVVVAASASILLARHVWFGELVASFELHVGLFALATAASLVLFRTLRLAAAIAVIGCVHVAPDVLLHLPPSSTARAAHRGPPPTLRVLSANVLQTNRHYGDVSAALLRADADVIGVVELSLPMLLELERELRAWPHRVLAPGRSEWTATTWGVALFSRKALRDVRRVQLFECYAPLIEARVGDEASAVTVRLAHLPRPGSAWRVEARNEALRQLAEQFEWGERALLMGDLNTTSSSPAFDDLLESTGLRDSRQGFGRQPSWWLRTRPILRRAGAPGWLAALLELRAGIAIDHALTGAGLETVERRVVELPFSDHAGVLADFRVSIAPR